LRSVGPKTTLVSDEVEVAMRELKARLAGEVDVSGPELARSLTDLGMVDEYRLYFHPGCAGRRKAILRRPSAAAPPDVERPDRRAGDQADLRSGLTAPTPARRL
jgi:riboflavin biosynthesis pyrimidine reductase